MNNKSLKMTDRSEPELINAEEGKKYRQFMFVQQLQYLGYDLDGLNKRLSAIKPLEYAYIVHDKDVKDDGSLVDVHLHLALRFQNPVSLKQLAKSLNVEPQYIDQWRGSANNMYSYLVHRTNAAAERYQYGLEEVMASFNFVKRMDQIEQGIQQRTGKKDGAMLNEVLDDLLDGNLTLIEAFNVLPGRITGKHRAKLQAAYQTRMELNAQQWYANKKKTGNPVQVLWFYGLAGAGKTRYAKDYLAKLDDGDVFVTGSNRDPFQNYTKTFAHKVILDDIRPRGSFSYEELLRMFDPWETEVSVGSRYADKNLQVDVYIITTPLAPNIFVEDLQVFEIDDNFDQLLRRLTAVLYFDDDFIYPALPFKGYDGHYHYDLDKENRVVNKWSGGKRNINHTQNLIQSSREQTTQFFTKAMVENNDESVSKIIKQSKEENHEGNDK